MTPISNCVMKHHRISGVGKIHVQHAPNSIDGFPTKLWNVMPGKTFRLYGKKTGR